MEDQNENEPVANSAGKETKADLIKALAAAKAEFPRIEKTATANIPIKDKNGRYSGKSYSYSYATLDVVRQACDPILAKHGLAVVHTTTIRDNGQLLLTTTLWHESGQSIESFWPLIADPSDPQKVGSAMTYAERYTYCAMIGVAAGEVDDDGALAMEKSKGGSAKKATASKDQSDKPTRGQRGPGITAKLATAFGVPKDKLEAYGKDKAVFASTSKATYAFKQALDDDSGTGPGSARADLLSAFVGWVVRNAQEAEESADTRSADWAGVEDESLPAESELGVPESLPDTTVTYDKLVSQVAAKMAVKDIDLGSWIATAYEDPDDAAKDLNTALASSRALVLLRQKFVAASSKVPKGEGGDQ